jgi:hypothetical protein
MHILWDEFHSYLSLLCSFLMILVCGNKASSDCFPQPHSMNGVFYLPYTYMIVLTCLCGCVALRETTVFGTWCKVEDVTVQVKDPTKKVTG